MLLCYPPGRNHLAFPWVRTIIRHRLSRNAIILVFVDVLTAMLAGRKSNSMPEPFFTFKNPLRMVAQHSMAIVSMESFGGIKPIMDGKIVLHHASPFPHRRK
jgi:hypothetical protein